MPQYVTLPATGYPQSATGVSSLPWILPPGRWRILAAKMTLITDATPGGRQIAFQIVGPDTFEVTEVCCHPNTGLGPSTTSYIFCALGQIQNWTNVPVYVNQLPDFPVEQDDTGNWAFQFHNSTVTGPGDLWRGCRFLVERVAGADGGQMAGGG